MARWAKFALLPAAVCAAAAAAAGCASGNQALYEPAYGGGGPPQCGIADAPPPPPAPTPWNPPSTPRRSAPPVTMQSWEQHAQSSQMIAAIAQAGARVGRMLETARAQKDVVKTMCMNDKLAQIDVALRAAVERKVSLTEAAGRGDAELSTHEFTVISTLSQRVNQLNAEANQCVGEEASFAAETVVMAQVSAGSSGSARRRAPARTTADSVKVMPGVQRDEIASRRRVAQAPPPAPPPPRPGSFHGPPAADPSPARPTTPPAEPKPAPPPRTGPAPTPPASVLTIDAPHDESLMVYSADVGLAVPHIEKGLDAIESIGRDLGGYLSQRADRQITIFVPRGRFAEAIKTIERLGDVRRHAISALDVTDEFVDLEVRITNARAVRERLIVLRAQAKTVSAQLEAEVEIGRLTGEIDRMEGKLKLLSEKIAYSTITVSLELVAEPIVCATTVLPFPWLQEIGLSALLNVHE